MARILLPGYYRARMEAIRHLLTKADERDVLFLRNGAIPEKYKDEAEQFRNKNFFQQSDEPLTFSEITRYNTWFEMYPEKIAGREEFTTSLNFPITVKGTKEDIIRTITGEEPELARNEPFNPGPSAIELEAEALALELELLNIEEPVQEMKSKLLTKKERDQLPAWQYGKKYSGQDYRLEALNLKKGETVRDSYSGEIYRVKPLILDEKKRKRYNYKAFSIVNVKDGNPYVESPFIESERPIYQRVDYPLPKHKDNMYTYKEIQKHFGDDVEKVEIGLTTYLTADDNGGKKWFVFAGSHIKTGKVTWYYTLTEPPTK